MWGDIDFPKQRRELVRLLVKCGITDESVLGAMGHVPRERFVPAKLHRHAYDNKALEIGAGQTISQPLMVATMTAELRLTGVERVLEIGTGSGYQTAILSRLAGWVYSIERIAELSQTAGVVLRELGCDNVELMVGDGTLGWPEMAPFDRILVTAGAPALPKTLASQLANDGLMVIPVESGENQSLRVYRNSGGELTATHVCDCRFVPLLGAEGYHES